MLSTNNHLKVFVKAVFSSLQTVPENLVLNRDAWRKQIEETSIYITRSSLVSPSNSSFIREMHTSQFYVGVVVQHGLGYRYYNYWISSCRLSQPPLMSPYRQFTIELFLSYRYLHQSTNDYFIMVLSRQMDKIVWRKIRKGTFLNISLFLSSN